MRTLERHGRDLLRAIESLDLSEIQLCLPTRDQRTVRGNFRALATIYFRIANAFQHDTLPFLERLEEDQFTLALSGVQEVWLNDFGENYIMLSLYTYFIHRLGPEHRVCRHFKRLVGAGQITFDPGEPGISPPPDPRQSAEYILAEARKVLASTPDSEAG